MAKERRQSLVLRVVPFSEEALISEIRLACGAEELGGAELVPDQVTYLCTFLKRHDRKARTLLIESPYVDRHYIEEFVGYYATALNPPPSKATRIHFLTEPIDEPKFRALLLSSASGQEEGGSKYLQTMSLGYVVVRPIPSAPIGRTVLAPYYSASARRDFGPLSPPHRVHLAGLQVAVEGVAFQQQDQAVGACATAAIWSAISRVARADGGRAPTPLAITLAATRHHLSDRALPASSGLDLGQTLAAIRESGFSPWVLKPGGDYQTFKLAVKCCLRSGIPVILTLKYEDEPAAHSIVAVGFREDDDEESAPQIKVALGKSRVLTAKGMSRIYAHDDRLGPYARFVWKDSKKATKKADAWPEMQFFPSRPGFKRYAGAAKIWDAVAPLYPKLRLAPTDLISVASELLPMIQEEIAGDRRDSLIVDLSYAHGGTYLERVLRQVKPGTRAVEAVTLAALPRYVGIIRYLVGDDEWLLDVVCDTTDIERDARPPILLAIPKDDAILPVLRGFRPLLDSLML